MRVDLEGPPIDKFDFDAALSVFKSQRERRIF